MQQQPPVWYKQQIIQLQHQQQQQQQQQRQMHNYPAPPYTAPHRPRAPQMGGYQAGFGPDQYSLQQMKANNPQQAGMMGGGMQQGGPNQGVMGPPTPQHAIQQQLMHSVRSPPPIRSPQPTPSPRAAPSPRAPPSASPRAQPSPHHLPSHSPVPQPGNDMHNHMHPHPSPVGGGPPDNIAPGNDALTAQDQLSKFVEQL